MHGAGEVLGVEPFLLHPLGQLLPRLRHHLHQGQAIAALEGRAQGIGQPLLHPFPGHQPVHHHLDVVGVVLVELDVVGELAHLAVDANSGKALSNQTPQQLNVAALLAPHHRSQ